jgi:hypothetical protein
LFSFFILIYLFFLIFFHFEFLKMDRSGRRQQRPLVIWFTFIEFFFSMFLRKVKIMFLFLNWNNGMALN